MLLLLPALLAVQTTPLDAFRGNIAAIHARNRAAYLSHYLHTPALARVGPDGLRQGYDSFAAGVGAAWPDTLVAAPPPVALVGATLVDGTGAAPVRNAVVVIRDGRIACAGPRPRCPVPDDADTVRADGKWITPGLIDTHVHFSQTGWGDGRPDALDLRDSHPYEQVE